MRRKSTKCMSMLVSVMMLFAMAFSTYAAPAANAAQEMKLTVLGTSDMHGNITSWSYEANTDYGNNGLARVGTLVKEAKAQNPNTIVIDAGDTIQGTILVDDLYNNDLSKPNPMMDIMNVIGYDAMALGNHEFNFGTDLIKKIEKEAKFPILSANVYKKGTDENFVKPYTVKEVSGVKVGILGLTVPDIMKYDSGKQGVKDLEYKHMANEAEKWVKVLEETEKVDVIVAIAHAGLESRDDTDGAGAAKMIAEKCPQIDVLLTGHDHMTVNETINGVLVAAPYKDREVVRFDLTLAQKNGKWDVADKATTIVKLEGVTPDADVTKAAEPYHAATMKFLEGTIGTATADFHPASEVKGIPEAQIRDTAVIDIINDVQMKATGADVGGAALFKPTSNLPKGPLNYANVFDIYQYANTLVGVEVTGKELKAYMEWSASYYNTYNAGDLTISFNPSIRGYAYDMFQGVDYEVDISQPAGSRIKNVMYKGAPLKDDQVLKLAINDYRYSGIGPDSKLKIISGKPYYESTPKTLRSAIKEYIVATGTIEPKVDNNWKIVGTNFDPELRAVAVKAVNEGKLSIPKAADGRTENVRSITEADLIKAGLHPKYKSQMTVIHTNDTHGRLESGSSDGVGFARIATQVNAVRNDYGKENVLVLDAGDTLHGLPLVTATQGEPVIKVMNAIGYDAMVPGNHDFNYDQKRLLELASMAKFPIISSNIVKADGKELLTPYIIKEVAGKKVGIFGLSTPETLYKTHPKNTVGLTFKNSVETAKAMVAELKDKTDMIIALSHLGLDEESTERSEIVAAQVEGIDLIVDGHSHTTLPTGKKVGNTMIVQTGDYDKNIGKVDIFFKADGTFDIVPTLINKADGMGLAEDETVAALITELKTTFDAATSTVVAKTAVKLDGERADVRTKETNMGNLITNAMRHVTGADIALTNGGGIRASINAGDITKKDAITVLPFGNTVVTINVTGQEILDALEVGVAAAPEANGGFAHVAGMSYTYDASKPVGKRVEAVLVGGKAIDPKATYSMATNDFTAAGGDKYVMFGDNPITGEYMALDEALIKYLQEKGTADIETGTRIIPAGSETTTKPAELPKAA